MKKILLLLFFASGIMNAQETEFKFAKEGFTDYVVGIVEGKTAQELYKKTLDWVSITYKNPKEVIKAQIENDYIRIEGSKSNMICMKALGMLTCNDVRYQIEISLKEGKYKFDLTKLEQYTPPSKYTVISGWSEVGLANTSVYYKENGDLRSLFKLYPTSIETEFNSLNTSLKDFLKSDTIPSKKSDW
ncbi:DUF4468 domain-containing protein [Flavobacterium sp. K5-23]|uniref:DUF4468 domain-containing protein n=1 Tax=Flavobacterium sp. K5-23 TaxID=2746225 RepID=UPI00200E08A3|nr:DUF4468 domain-containing protein [Flavobacterium sp. K5-23]UQD54998.1 DUF4468 domain-containing protein [Flavobacterium sp. K5-23]